MLAKIRHLFQLPAGGASAQLDTEQKRLACAALLIEVAIADHEFDALELESLQQVLANSFGIAVEESNHYINLARQASHDSTSLHEFTRIINASCTEEAKFELIVGMWQIAFADGELDKYEDYIIRKVADLIYVSQGDFIRAKHLARLQLA